ncbi:MAG: hypothetical protein QME71_06145 [Dehalococcoidia bacterium]|nr:hypothetical protein [Dehalococcoidia bacterium]
MALRLRKRPVTFLLLAAALALMAAGCGEGKGEGREGETLVFEGVTYQAAGSLGVDALSEEEAEQVGESEGGQAVYRRKAQGKDWQLLTQDEGGWTVWEPSAVAVAIDDLAGRLDAPAEEIEVQEVTRVTWPDACLGAAQPGEACAQVLTDGFRIILSVEGRAYEYHSDLHVAVRPLG